MILCVCNDVMCESGSTFIIHAILQLPQSKESSSKETVINVGGKYVVHKLSYIYIIRSQVLE